MRWVVQGVPVESAGSICERKEVMLPEARALTRLKTELRRARVKAGRLRVKATAFCSVGGFSRAGMKSGLRSFSHSSRRLESTLWTMSRR